MKKTCIETKVQKTSNGLTCMVMRIGDIAIQSEFQDLIQYDFPIRTHKPIPLEIPANGSKSSILGSFGNTSTEANYGGYANLIKIPDFASQRIISLDEYNRFQNSSKDKNGTYDKVPVFALASQVCSIGNQEKHEKSLNILPVWSDGTSVLLTLDYFEGEASEGTPNAEWHINASQGMSLELGIQTFYTASKQDSENVNRAFHIYMTPWALGAEILKDKGIELGIKGWQREWAFNDSKKYIESLDSILGEFMGNQALEANVR